MKTRKFSVYILIIALGMLFVQCEGPPGPAGSDGTDGVDGNSTCLECHSTVIKNAIDLQFQQSVHSAGAIAVDYAGGRASCAMCHSHEGFVEYAETGDVGEDISNPSAWKCGTCHSIHETFGADDYAFRLADPVALIFDETVVLDMGNSNLCLNCHQSRRAEPNISDPGATFEITSTHYGPHHGSQANILQGVGFAEIPGSTSYPAAGISNHIGDGGNCTGCHMYEYGDGEGGHTFNPSLASCNECHIASGEDFDYGGVQTDTEELLIELRDLLLAANVIEYVVEDEAYEPIPGTYPMVEVQAFFNWVGIEEDRSLGVHNPAYITALLENSIEALGGK